MKQLEKSREESITFNFNTDDETNAVTSIIVGEKKEERKFIPEEQQIALLQEVKKWAEENSKKKISGDTGELIYGGAYNKALEDLINLIDKEIEKYG